MTSRVFERVRPLLQLFGKNVFHVGATPGQGQTAKLLNNLLSATALAITSEAVTFGVTAGLDPATLLEVFNAGTGRNTATATKFPDQVLTRRFASGFRLELMAKDLELCLGEVRAKRFPMQLGGARAAALDAGRRAGRRASADHTEIVRFFERCRESRSAPPTEEGRMSGSRAASSTRTRSTPFATRRSTRGEASSSTATRATESPTPRSRWPTTSGCSVAATRRFSSTPGSVPRSASAGDERASSHRSTALRRLGVEPEAVSTVVVTHFHYDHIGNLDAFPQAQLIVPETELEFWTGPMAARYQFGSHVEPREIAYIEQARGEGRVRTTNGTEEILEGVTAIEVGGHSPGQQLTVVESAGGTSRARVRRRPLLRGARARAAVRGHARPRADVRRLRRAQRVRTLRSDRRSGPRPGRRPSSYVIPTESSSIDGAETDLSRHRGAARHLANARAEHSEESERRR